MMPRASTGSYRRSGSDRHGIRSPHPRFLLIPLVLSAAAIASAATTAPSATADEKKANIIFFGDSLTEGYGLANPLRDAYPALIQARIDAAGLPYHVVNAGLSGDTTAAGLRRVDWVLRQPVSIFVLALGANDGLRGVPPDTTRQNLLGILQHVRARDPDARLVVVGMMMPSTMGTQYTDAFKEVFSDVAEKYQAAFVPFLLEGVGGISSLNQADGIHPNPRGHVILADNVWKILRPLLTGSQEVTESADTRSDAIAP